MNCINKGSFGRISYNAAHKGFVNRRPNTNVAITARGQQAIERHWTQLEDLRKESQSWKPEKKGSQPG